MKYFVIYESTDGLEVFPTDDCEAALQFAAQQKLNGSGLVQLAERMPGELVLTAQLVPQESSASPKKAERRPAKLSRPKGAKRTPAEIDKLRVRLLSLVQTKPGQSAEDISRALMVEAKDLVLPMKRLVADKSVRTKGKARGTKYWPAPRSRKPVRKTT